MAAEKKLREEQEGKSQPMFVFGSKISDRVVKVGEASTYPEFTLLRWISERVWLYREIATVELFCLEQLPCEEILRTAKNMSLIKQLSIQNP